MNQYRLIASYNTEYIGSERSEDVLTVTVPMLSNSKLMYGLSHIKNKMYAEGIYPSENGFDVMALAAMHKAFGDDGTVYTETSIRKMQNRSSEGIGVQLRSFQFAIDKVKNNPNIALLLIHKPGPLPQDDGYLAELADTYRRGLLEVDTFIQESVSQEVDNDAL